MFYAILPHYAYSETEQEEGNLPDPFEHLALVGPYGSKEELKTSVLPIIVGKLNKKKGGVRENFDEWLIDHKKDLEREKREVALASAPTTPKNYKRQSRPYTPSKLTAFLLKHAIPDPSAEGKQMLNITTYEDLSLFSKLYQVVLQGGVQLMPLIYSSANVSADAPPVPMQRVHEDEDDSNPTKRRKTEEAEDDGEEEEEELEED